jgi:hypothetical protein
MAPRPLLLLLLVLSGCSKGPQADLQYIKQARSIAAEWALVNEQASRGKLTDIYVASMHQWLRQQLETSAASLTEPGSAYGREIDALLAMPDDAAAEDLRHHSERLKQAEDELESA